MTTVTELSSLESLRSLDFSKPPQLPLPTPMPAKAKERKAPEVEMTKPVFIRKLADKLGQVAAAKAIGITGPTVCVAIRDDNATLRLENAAMGVWLRDHEPKVETNAPLASNEVVVALRMRKPEWDHLSGWFKEQGIEAVVLSQSKR